MFWNPHMKNHNLPLEYINYTTTLLEYIVCFLCPPQFWFESPKEIYSSTPFSMVKDGRVSSDPWRRLTRPWPPCWSWGFLRSRLRQRRSSRRRVVFMTLMTFLVFLFPTFNDLFCTYVWMGQNLYLLTIYIYIYMYNYIFYIWGPISIHKSHHSPAKTYELTIFGAHDAINCHKSQQLIRVSRSHLLRLRLLLRLPGACWSALRGGRRRPWRPATQRPWRKWRTRRSGQGSPGVTMETNAVNRCIWACWWYLVA